MEYRTLGKTGLKLSALSFGASSLGGVFQPINEADGIRTVHVALDGGINFIDVAPFYGLTKAESVLGKALKTVPRDKYVLATKVGRYGQDAKDFDFGAKRTKASVDESLGRLGVDHIDLIQVHDMEFGDLDQVISETIPALREVVQAGKARFIGITGLPIKTLKYVAERAAVDTVLSYCHYELNDTAYLDLLPLLEQKGLGILSAAPLGMGLLSDNGPPSWHPAPADVKAACREAAEHCRSRGSNLSKLAVQFAVRQPRITSTIVGTADPQIIADNIAAVSEPIDQELLAQVLEILKPVHNLTWQSGRAENN